jgi:protein-tyrosine-phosphatase
MAEGILKARWSALGRDDLIVSSMGIYGLDHQPAAESARKICWENGIDISQHISRVIEFEEMNRSDLIFVMEMAQKEYILLFLPQLAERLFLLGSWPERDSAKGNIKDPICGSYKDYSNAFQVISRRINTILPYLQSQFA